MIESIMLKILKLPCSRGRMSWADKEIDVHFKMGHQEARGQAMELVKDACNELAAAQIRIAELEKLLREK